MMEKQRYYAQTGQFDGSIQAGSYEEAAELVVLKCAKKEIPMGNMIMVSSKPISAEDSGCEQIFRTLRVVSELSKKGRNLSAKMSRDDEPEEPEEEDEEDEEEGE
jgi:hypothetical protein